MAYYSIDSIDELSKRIIRKEKKKVAMYKKI